MPRRAEATVPEVQEDLVRERLGIVDKANEEQLLTNVNAGLNGFRATSSPSKGR